MKLDQAIDKVLEGFDNAVFIRNVGGDAVRGSMIKLAPYIQALAVLARHRESYPECSICRDRHPNDDRHPCE